MLKASISCEQSLVELEESRNCSSPNAESAERLRSGSAETTAFLVFRAVFTNLAGTCSMQSDLIALLVVDNGRIVVAVLGRTILRTILGAKLLGCVKYCECRVMTSSVSSEISFFFSEAGADTFKQNSLAIRVSMFRKDSSKRTSLLDLDNRVLEIVECRSLFKCNWDRAPFRRR